ncbi:LysR family transcriptional regulator [Leucobacter sp. UCD-THU]|uniref:LysR family transcriptional regulator n=1 Tax=Leucobacter sp. UCD-THU TaxID=1292023 RepID=UPI00037E2473|nr:LysR family transcriptional regulator [Leucobacter sp. UCD-THU]EYT52171.1 LysR family transcriptional regulator [Leucobacter sp. UCD-THU]
MRINVARLPYFLQISRSGGVLAAAEALKLTPSAVSQQLARLEAEVGVPLVERSPRGIVPTAAGRELIELAENVEREVNEAARRVGAASELPSGRVRFGAFQSFIGGLLAPALPQWRGELSGVDLLLVEGEQAELLRGLRAAELDLVAVEFDESVAPTPPGPGVREVALLDDPWVLVAPAGTQAAMGVVELENLRLPWLEVDLGAGASHAVRRVRRSLPHSSTAPHRYGNHQTALALVAAGEGVTLLPQLALREQALPGVEVHELPGLGVRRISLRFRSGRKPNPAVAAAVDFLRAVVAGEPAPEPAP